MCDRQKNKFGSTHITYEYVVSPDSTHTNIIQQLMEKAPKTIHNTKFIELTYTNTNVRGCIISQESKITQ